MSEQRTTEISVCLGSLDGLCLRRAAQLGLQVQGRGAAFGGNTMTSKIAMIDLRCLTAQGLLCECAPRKPSYVKLVLRVGEVVVRRFKKRCRQTELLEVLQSCGWPVFIDHPLGRRSPIDPENGLNDTVYQLNRGQRKWPRIHFWCVGGRLYWEIARQHLIASQRQRPTPWTAFGRAEADG